MGRSTSGRKERDRSKSPSKRKKYKHRDGSSSDSGDDRRSKHKRSSKKSSKHKSRNRSPSSSPDVARRKVLDLEKLKEKRKLEKEMMKAIETPEEKRQRRLAKKEAKERKRKSNMGWDDETLRYTNEDNPFGDHQLTETFVWASKLKKEGKSVDKEEVLRQQATKREENKRELEKVKRRRLEREKEKEIRDKEREMEQREKETNYYSAWEKQEDTFHLDQAKERSKIRIEDGRAKPIDLLAKYINAEDDDMSVEMHEPYTYLEGLSIDDLEDLLEDITVYLELEQGKNQDYWRDITTVADDQLAQLRRMDPSALDRYMRDRREGIHNSVTQEVNAVFKGKTLNQLTILQEQIRNKLQGGEGIDVNYWESLLQQLKAHIALTRLKERHQEILKQRLAKLRQEQVLESVEANKSDSDGDFAKPSTSRQAVAREFEDSSMPPPPTTTKTAEELKQDDSDEEDVLPDVPVQDAEDEYDSGRCSPKLLTIDELEEGTLIYQPEEDMKRLEYQRQSLKKTGQVQKTSDGGEAFLKRAQEGMDREEARFSVEYNLEQQSFIWSDKYRPRKPRFFNRVHTGFEWNKYNQTHYDMDNPPPKIVQGYKFNIFYPDLIDKTKAPEYSVVPIDDDKDFSVLKFSAGPPYEDIAFKIVNREWEYSYKHGFKCQFQNDIFQLWFHFRRYRYRR